MFRFLFIIISFSSAMIFAQQESTIDSSGITTFIEAFDAAWNTHNSPAIASLWLEDGDVMIPWGQWIMGRNQIEKHFQKESTGPFGKSKIEQSIDAIRFLNPENAVVDTTFKIEGVSDPNGVIPPSLLQHTVYILKKANNQWKIVSARMYLFQSLKAKKTK